MIRRAKISDIPRLCELMTQLGSNNLPNPSKVRDKFNYIINSPDYYVVVWSTNEILLGSATILLEHRFSTTKSIVAHLENVIVDEKYRKMGYGSRLIKNCLEFAKRAGAYKVILNCSEENVRYYEKLGFKAYEVGMRMDL